MKHIAVVSNKKFLGKIQEDRWLADALEKAGNKAKVVAWNDELTDWKQFDKAVIRSVWGYHHELSNFSNWIESANRNLDIVNSVETVNWNMRKDLQLKLLEQSKIPTIPTVVVNEASFVYHGVNERIETGREIFNALVSCMPGEDNFVIKPCISGSGNNTYLFNLSDESLSRPNQIASGEAQKILDRSLSIAGAGSLVQPFISDIDRGEVSLIYIGQELNHAVRRRPAIFGSRKETSVIPIDEITDDMSELGTSVLESINTHIYSAFENKKLPSFSRIDFVENSRGLAVMEIELIDPDLFFRKITSSNVLASSLEKLSYKISMD